MELSVLIILLALIQYLIFSLQVGASRPKYTVTAPKISGDETWERLFRVHQNTLEQLIIFIPAMIIFAQYVSTTWVVIPGALFLLGRQIYAISYVKDPKSRTLGFGLTFLSNVSLVLGSLATIIWGLVM